MVPGLDIPRKYVTALYVYTSTIIRPDHDTVLSDPSPRLFGLLTL